MDNEEFIIRSEFARDAFTQAELALERGDRPVGAVIVHNDKVIARASDASNTEENGLAHAVIRAILKIPELIRDYGPECSIYTTYEPCLMCLGAITNNKIPEIHCMTGTHNPRKYDLAGSIKKYEKGLNEKWSNQLFQKYNEKYLPDGLPLPPAHLRFKVIANTDVEGFLDSNLIDQFNSILSKHGTSVNAFSSILDFGCGCGRMVRHWKKFSQIEVHGSDYNPELINWCKNNLKFAKFQVNSLAPPINYPDNKFDFMYMMSVFTHLSEELQAGWIKEIFRILKPGGFLFFSTHGNAYTDQLTEQESANYQANKLVVKNIFVEGTNDCATFQAEGQVRESFADRFELLEFIPGTKSGPTGEKDQYLFRKSIA